MLHAVYQHDDKRCVYDTLDLDGSMLGSRDNDRAADAFIAPLISGAYSIETHITPEHCYYSELLTTAENMISAAKGDTPLLDMLIKSELLRFMFLLYESGSISRNGFVKKSSLMRLKLARELLRDTDKSVADIAFECGYHNLSNFNRQFRSAGGCSPKEYRSRCTDSDQTVQND